MNIVRNRAFARAGLIGNPSDGYGGKTLSIIVRDYWAEAVLYEWEDVEIMWSQEDQSRFGSVMDLLKDVRNHGYYGGVRLVKATIKKFVEYCVARNIELHTRNFSVRYQSNIPRQVGLAGSSAIITSVLRCLMSFYDVSIPIQVQPSLALSVETEELGIAAGLQDRVIQAYEGAVFMNFDPQQATVIEGYCCGIYEPLDPTALPPVYLAFDATVSEPTEVVHNDVRARYQMGDPAVVDAMSQFADLTERCRVAIEAGDWKEAGRLMDENFDLRASICAIAPGQRRMIEVARQAGANAKFAGSGGAIIGICSDSETYRRLETALSSLGCRVFRPTVVP